MFQDNINITEKIYFVLGNHPELTNFFDEEYIPNEIMELKLRKNESETQFITLLYDDCKPSICIPFKGTTIRDWLFTLYEGLHSRIIKENLDYETRYKIDRIINQFYRDTDRMRLYEKLDSGELKYLDLVGDHEFFEGPISLEGNVWEYSLGS